MAESRSPKSAAKAKAEAKAPAAQAPGADPDGSVRFGAQIRQRRQLRGMTIQELAEATGLTKGHLSQVERDLASVSVASLVRLCDALDISVGSLFDKPATNYVARADRPLINFGGAGVEEYLLTPSTESRVQVIEQVIDPGGGGGDEQYSLRAEAEFVHLLRGRLEVRVGDETIVLSAGDSLTFSAREPHTWRNPSDRQQAHAIWVFSPALM
jgi:transcriptional regulator with XRE-family HTH domain